MSFQTFLNDPKGYLATHSMFIHSTNVKNQALHAGPNVAGANGFTNRVYTIVGGQFLTMQQSGHGPAKLLGSKTIGNVARKIHVSSKVRVNYNLALAAADIGFRYLPDQEGYVTCMAADGAATFLLTGEITGCTIAAGRDNAGTLWFFHSFRPQALANTPVVQMAQFTAIDVLRANMNIQNADMRYCRYGHQYNGMGFAFGRLRGNVWKFYAHATNANGISDTTKWGEI